MAYIDCENCYHGEVCTYRRASHDKIVLCEHWQPTADVVEVVRCKDCRFAKEYILYDGFYRCENDGLIHRADGFCSYGERKVK